MNAVAGAYAKALAELAEEQGCEQDVYHASLVLQSCLQQQPEYLVLLTSPMLTKQERLALLEELLAQAPVLLRHTVLLQNEKNEGGLLAEMLNEFVIRYRHRHGILPVVAVSAVPLSTRLKASLQQALAERTRKEILLQYRVDPTCMGGLRLQMDGRLFDNSVQTRLEEVRKLLMSDSSFLTDQSHEGR